MKTVFIINPAAGQGRGIDKLKAKIRQAAEESGCEAGIYTTKGSGDAEKFARQFCCELMEEKTPAGAPEAEGRLIACGGDGTFNEVLNGAIDCPRVSLGLVPTGTGNDFVRNFPAADFRDLAGQMRGRAVSCDAIRYWGQIDGKQQTRYCANMFNIGFDCNVVDTAAHLKNYPLVAGSFAYLLAVAAMYVRKKGANLRVEIDGEVVQDGPLLLTALANGGYCGGGVNSAPYASLEDGLMDVNIIFNVSRLEFLRKFPYYAKGTHMQLHDIDHVIRAYTCRTARLTPLDGVMRLCTDGEIVDAGVVDFAVEPGAFRLVLPERATEQAEENDGEKVGGKVLSMERTDVEEARRDHG